MKTLLALAIAAVAATSGTAFAEDTPYYQRLAYDNLYKNVDNTATEFSTSNAFSVAPVSGQRFESIVPNLTGGGQLKLVHVRGADGSLRLLSSTNIDSK